MNQLISISEPVLTRDEAEGPVVISATAEGQYDTSEDLAIITLDTTRSGADGKTVPCTWLPAREVIREHVPRDEATVLARDVFEHWAEKVRQAIATHEASLPASGESAARNSTDPL